MRVINSDRLLSHGNVEGRKIALDILEKGLEASDSYNNAKSILNIKNDCLYIGNDDFVPTGSPRTGIDCLRLGEDVERIFVFGAGKGIQRVALALEDALGEHLTGGLVLLKHHDKHDLKKIAVRFASHPVPEPCCIEACKDLVEAIENAHLTEKDLVFTIIGNGASSMMTYPWEGLKLEDVAEVTRIMQIEKGLPTPTLNIVRNQLDRLKGGRITRLLLPAKMVHLFTIDLNEPNAYGYGGYYGHTHWNFWLHTLPDISTPEKAIEILKDNEVWDRIGDSVRNYLSTAPEENNVLSTEEFEATDSRIFGLMPTEHNFIPAVMNYAKSIGYEPHFLMRRTFVDAAVTGNLISRIAVNVENESMPFQAPCVLLLTGEMVVSVNVHKGVGGRNQEFALSASQIIKNSKRIVSVSVDTDGTDGPGGDFDPEATKMGCCCLAGGMVDGYTALEAEENGVDIKNALRTHDTSAALWKLDSGIWANQNISVQDLIFMVVMDHDGEKV